MQFISDDFEQINPEETLRQILGNNYIGCTVRNGNLIEFRTKTVIQSNLDKVNLVFNKSFSEVTK